MRKPEELYGWVEPSVDIFCSNCKESDSLHHIDEYEACEVLFKNGWRATKSNVYCPKCALKKLKKL